MFGSKLPARWECAKFAAEAERQNVLVRSSEPFAVDDQPRSNAVRLSLSTPNNIDDVRNGLEIVRDIVDASIT